MEWPIHWVPRAAPAGVPRNKGPLCRVRIDLIAIQEVALLVAGPGFRNSSPFGKDATRNARPYSTPGITSPDGIPTVEAQAMPIEMGRPQPEASTASICARNSVASSSKSTPARKPLHLVEVVEGPFSFTRVGTRDAGSAAPRYSGPFGDDRQMDAEGQFRVGGQETQGVPGPGTGAITVAERTTPAASALIMAWLTA